MTAEQKKEFRDKFGDLYHQLNMEQWIDNLVDEACKKQREICADEFRKCEDAFWNSTDKDSYECTSENCIRNAPSPKESESP